MFRTLQKGFSTVAWIGTSPEISQRVHPFKRSCQIENTSPSLKKLFSCKLTHGAPCLSFSLFCVLFSSSWVVSALCAPHQSPFGIKVGVAPLSLAKIPSTLKSLTFFHRRATTSTHYEETTKSILDHIFALQKDLRSRSGEPCTSPATSHHETLEQAPSTSPKRPPLLRLALSLLERLARGFDRCQT